MSPLSCLTCWIELVNVMTLAEPLDEVVNLLLMDPVVFLPAFPWVVWVQAPKCLEYLVRCTIGLVEEILGEQHVIRAAVAHLFFRGLWERVIILGVIKFVLVSAIKFHPRSSRMVRCLLGNLLPECNHIKLALRFFLVIQQLDQERDILICKCDTLSGRTAEQCLGRRWGARSFSIAKFSTDPLPDVDDTIGTGPGSDGLSGSYSIPSFAIIAEVVIHRIAAESNLVLVAVSAPRVKGVMRGFYSNSFTDLSQAENETLCDTIFDILFQIVDILMRE